MDIKNSGQVDLSSDQGEQPKAKVVIKPFSVYDQGEKVIQPLSQNVGQPQIGSDETGGSNQTQTTQTGTVTKSGKLRTKSSNLWSNLNFIYPEAKFGLNHQGYESLTKKAQPPLELSKTKLALINTLIILFSSVMLLITAVNLYSWVRVGSSDGAIDIFALILLTAALLVEVGIFLRQNIARTIFVFLSIIFLVFSISASYSYFKDVRNQQKANQSVISQANQKIAHYESDTYLTQAQISSVVNSLKLNEQLQLQPTLKAHNILLPILESYVIGILPIIFLTRPSVKSLFR